MQFQNKNVVPLLKKHKKQDSYINPTLYAVISVIYIYVKLQWSINHYIFPQCTQVVFSKCAQKPCVSVVIRFGHTCLEIS